MNIEIIHHYPPEILNLLVDTIPLLCRSKNDVLVFFKGAGVPGRLRRISGRSLLLTAAA
jgi:restriction system protein